MLRRRLGESLRRALAALSAGATDAAMHMERAARWVIHRLVQPKRVPFVCRIEKEVG
jgi:hypothetical protein